MLKVTIPGYDYFLNSIDVGDKKGSPFNGSVGTDPATGFINVTNFEYSIMLRKSGEGEMFFDVECRVRPPFCKAGDSATENHDTARFSGTADSIESIREWLEERAFALLG